MWAEIRLTPNRCQCLLFSLARQGKSEYFSVSKNKAIAGDYPNLTETLDSWRFLKKIIQVYFKTVKRIQHSRDEEGKREDTARSWSGFLKDTPKFLENNVEVSFKTEQTLPDDLSDSLKPVSTQFLKVEV